VYVKINKAEDHDRKLLVRLSVPPRNTYFSLCIVFMPNKIIGK
jgi:hypothetical protein